MLSIEPRVAMLLPNTQKCNSNIGINELEDLEEIRLADDGTIELFFGNSCYDLIPGPVLALWNGDAFAGLVKPLPGIADAGRLIDQAEIRRIRDAYAEGRVLTSREVEGALAAARENLTHDDLPVMTARLSGLALDDMAGRQILEVAFGIDRWEWIGMSHGLGWFRSSNIEVGIGQYGYGETMTFYKKNDAGSPIELVTVSNDGIEKRRAA